MNMTIQKWLRLFALALAFGSQPDILFAQTWQNTPFNWANSSNSWDNSANNQQNSPSNYNNSLNNWNNSLNNWPNSPFRYNVPSTIFGSGGDRIGARP
jgi:hypothetical protein